MKNKFALLLVLTLLIGTGLRIYKLGSRDVWFDEAGSVYVKDIVSVAPQNSYDFDLHIIEA